MRKIGALVLAFLLTGSVSWAAPDAALPETEALASIPVLLEESAAAETAPKGEKKKAAGNDAEEEELVGEYMELIQKDSPMPFLKEMDLPRGWSFMPFHDAAVKTADREEWAGLLRTNVEDTDSVFLACGVELKGPEADKLFGGMYTEGNLSQETVSRLLRFNMLLVKSGNMLNEVFLKTIVTVNEGRPYGDRYPYNLISVDTGEPEQLHLMGDRKGVYTFFIRPVFAVDQWLVPLALRGYAYKKDGAYRFLFLAGEDSGRKSMEKAGRYLLDRYGN